MAKIFLTKQFLENFGDFWPDPKKSEFVTFEEYALEEGKYVAKPGGEHLLTIRPMGDATNRYFEIDIPGWDYPSSHFMLTYRVSSNEVP